MVGTERPQPRPIRQSTQIIGKNEEKGSTWEINS